jgi:hypothetical protein
MQPCLAVQATDSCDISESTAVIFLPGLKIDLSKQLASSHQSCSFRFLPTGYERYTVGIIGKRALQKIHDGIRVLLHSFYPDNHR